MNFHKYKCRAYSQYRITHDLYLSTTEKQILGEERVVKHTEIFPLKQISKPSKRSVQRCSFYPWIDFNIPLCEVIFSFVAIAMLGRKEKLINWHLRQSCIKFIVLHKHEQKTIVRGWATTNFEKHLGKEHEKI